VQINQQFSPDFGVLRVNKETQGDDDKQISVLLSIGLFRLSMAPKNERKYCTKIRFPSGECDLTTFYGAWTVNGQNRIVSAYTRDPEWANIAGEEEKSFNLSPSRPLTHRLLSEDK
jgi:hypothetical protein